MAASWFEPERRQDRKTERLRSDRLRAADTDGGLGVALFAYVRGPQDHTRAALRLSVLSHTNHT
jgi:hypothetical protein